MARLELYYFLLPFSLLSLLLYYRVLRKIYQCPRNARYSSFFYKITWSLALYDIPYVILYFLFEIPQDWPELYGFLYAMNGTRLPQLQYAHKWQCFLAEFYGVTLMSISRMLQLCHPSSRLAHMVTSLSTMFIIIFHGLPPFGYAVFVTFFQQYRRYEYDNNVGTITRIGDTWSTEFNSNVMIATSTLGAIISALCYTRIFLFLRNRPFRSLGNEVSMLFTSFKLFLSLCAMCAYYIINKQLLLAENWGLFYTNRNMLYIVSFSMALLNPWCLLITNSEIAYSHSSSGTAASRNTRERSLLPHGTLDDCTTAGCEYDCRQIINNNILTSVSNLT